jgi:predicted nicotinamide N-methyase
MSVSESGEVWADVNLMGSFRSPPKSSKLLKAIYLAVIVFVQSSVSISAFSCKTPVHNWLKRSNCVMMTTPDDVTNVHRERRRGKIGRVPIISRTISFDIKVPTELPGKKGSMARVYSGRDEIKKLDKIKTLDVTVWEMDKPSDLIQEWWSIDESERNARVGDPFGVVMWPGSILAAKELMKLHHSPRLKSPIVNATILVLGAGTGVEAQTAALLGAKRVIATDINPLTLKLLEYGANNDQRISDTFEGRFFDLFSDLALPACDVIIAADVLYNPELAKQVGRRLHEAIVRSFDAGASPTKVIITDSQRFHGTDFLEEVSELRELNAMFKEGNYEQLRWETQKLKGVCGSGVLIDEDQTYDVDVRMISWGW